MEKLINNVLEIGFLGNILWFIFVVILHDVINYGIRAYEKINNMEHTVYYYDIVFLAITIVFHVAGLYYYK